MGISKIFEKEAQRRFGDYQGGDYTKNEGKRTSILTGHFQCVCELSTLFSLKGGAVVQWCTNLGNFANQAVCCQLIAAINGQFLEQLMRSMLFNSKHSFRKI